MYKEDGQLIYSASDLVCFSKKAPFIQFCLYAEMLEQLQAIRPEHVVVSFGNDTNEVLRSDDYFYYCRLLKQRFLETQATFDDRNMPNPTDSADFGRWSNDANQLLIGCDDLSKIANVSRLQIKNWSKPALRLCAVNCAAATIV